MALILPACSLHEVFLIFIFWLGDISDRRHAILRDARMNTRLDRDRLLGVERFLTQPMRILQHHIGVRVFGRQQQR